MEGNRQVMKQELIGMGFEESKVNNVLMLTDNIEEATNYLIEGINPAQIAQNIKNQIILQLREMGFSQDIAKLAADRYKTAREAVEFATNASIYIAQDQRPQYNLRPDLQLPPPLPHNFLDIKIKIYKQLIEWGYADTAAQEIADKFNNYEEAIDYATRTINLNQPQHPAHMEPEPYPQENEDPENDLNLRDISIRLYQQNVPVEQAFLQIFQLFNPYIEEEEDQIVYEIPNPFPARSIQQRYLYAPNPAQSIYISPESINVEGRNIRGTSREEIIDILRELYPPKGASEEVKNKIAEVLYRDSSSQKTCTICQDDFHHNEPIYQLPCNHIYHKKCITKWLEMSEKCPIDNIKIE